MRGPTRISSERLSAQRPVSLWVTAHLGICGGDALFVPASHQNMAKHLRSARRRRRSLCTYAWANSDKLGEAVGSKAGLLVGDGPPRNMWRGRTFCTGQPPKHGQALEERPASTSQPLHLCVG